MTDDGAPGADEPAARQDPAPVAGADVAPAARSGRAAGRLLRGGLLAAAVAAVVGLDTGAVPLPASSPKAVVRPLAAAASSTPPADLAAAKARETAIRQTLGAASTALAAGDADGAAALVAPGRSATARTLRTMATNLHALPSTDVELVWSGSWTAPSSGSETDSVVANAVLSTFVRGYDTAPGAAYVSIGMERSGDRWLMTTWQWGTADEPPPWAVPGLTVVAKPHVLVVGQAKNAGVTRRLASRAEAAVVDAGRLWKIPGWNGKAVLFAVTDTEFLAAWFGAGQAGPGQDRSNWFNVRTTARADGPADPVGFRSVLATDYLLRDSRLTRADLRYMFTILAMQATSDGLLPAWLYRGSADYAAWRAQGATDGLETLRSRGLRDRTWTALRRGTWRPQLTDSQATFGEGKDAKVDNDWDSAFLTATYIADTFGEGALRGLLVDIGGGAATDVALRTRLKMNQEQLTVKVRAWARATAARA